MNLEIIRWLVRHREVLTKAIEAVRQWDPESSLIAKWSVVDEVARLIIPALDEDTVHALLDPWQDSDDVAAFSLGAEVHAMGLDWRTIVDVLLPVIIAVLKALAEKE